MTAGHLAEFGDRYEQWHVYMTDERPAVVADAARRASDARRPRAPRKLTGLRAMATQTADLANALGPQLYNDMIREEAFVEA